MTSKKIRLGMSVMALIFGFLLTGCELPEDEGTFEFRVSNTNSNIHLTKIEFINGSNESAPVLQTETISIKNGEMSGIYKVSGFTEKYEQDTYLYGIRVSFYDSWGGVDTYHTTFKYSHAADKSKIRVWYNAWGLSLENGDW